MYICTVYTGCIGSLLVSALHCHFGGPGSTVGHGGSLSKEFPVHSAVTIIVGINLVKGKA